MDQIQSPQDLFNNRDLSWLQFNERVLEQARRSTTPLLERLRFLAIFESNQDEFFMKRIGYLRRLRDSGRLETYPDGRPVRVVRREVQKYIHEMVELQSKIYLEDLNPKLRENNIQLLDWSEVTAKDKERIREYFRTRVFPVLTPLAVDSAHPFPFMSNLSVNLGVKLRQPTSNEPLFARIKIPDVLPQWHSLDAESFSDRNFRFVRLIDIVSNNLDELFPKMVIDEIIPFRVTRNADIDPVDDELEEFEDLMDVVEEELRQRRLARVVRLEVLGDQSLDPWVKNLLLDEFEIAESDLYYKKGEINFRTLNQIASLGFKNLKYKTWSPSTAEAFSEDNLDVFRAITDKDCMVHHPFDSFGASVERFVRAAVDDPKVLAIKMTLYRTEEKSPFIPLLIRAAEKGKQVVCVVELKARFDEARNIYWSEMLEKAGVHVVYGISGLKTHTKATLVVRDEKEGFRLYCHFGTGNYNSDTAKLYTDIGILTDEADIAGELVEVFNYLTGLSLRTKYKRILVAPINMKSRFLEMIEKEVHHLQKGKPARIIAKMNSLEDRDVCLALYQASQAGVKIDLIVRGFCCLRPGVPGLSENIRVISIVGRFLEHSRIYYFLSGSEDPIEGNFYIASADWMTRNLQSRVEIAVPIRPRNHRERCWDLLQIQLADQTDGWELLPDGDYKKPKHFEDPEKPGSQAEFIKRAKGAKSKKEKKKNKRK